MNLLHFPATCPPRRTRVPRPCQAPSQGREMTRTPPATALPRVTSPLDQPIPTPEAETSTAAASTTKSDSCTSSVMVLF